MQFLRQLLGLGAPKEVPPKEMASLDALDPLERFKRLSADDRMVQIMIKGDSGKLEYFPLLEYAILHDADSGVRFAALKRIHLFHAYPGARELLKRLMVAPPDVAVEPYLSMALHRLELINTDEFNRRINSQG